MLNLLNFIEAARELHVSVHTIRLWAHQRRFDTLKLGRRRLIEREVLERFARSRQIAARESQCVSPVREQA
jgi:excisionase family DNA binding protein